MTWLARHIDEHKGQIQAFLVLGPILLGVAPLSGLINPLWSSLFGFPLHVALRATFNYGLASSLVLFAFVVWPLVVFALMCWAASTLVSTKHKWRDVLVVSWAASAIMALPPEQAFLFFGDWPLYLLTY